MKGAGEEALRNIKIITEKIKQKKLPIQDIGMGMMLSMASARDVLP